MFDTIIHSMIVQRYYITFMEQLAFSTTTPTFSVTDTGFLLTADSVTYTMEWVGEMLKVTGLDTCYYLLETARGLEQANCALSTFTLLMGN